MKAAKTTVGFETTYLLAGLTSDQLQLVAWGLELLKNTPDDVCPTAAYGQDRRQEFREAFKPLHTEVFRILQEDA